MVLTEIKKKNVKRILNSQNFKEVHIFPSGIQTAPCIDWVVLIA